MFKRRLMLFLVVLLLLCSLCLPIHAKYIGQVSTPEEERVELIIQKYLVINEFDGKTYYFGLKNKITFESGSHSLILYYRRMKFYIITAVEETAGPFILNYSFRKGGKYVLGYTEQGNKISVYIQEQSSAKLVTPIRTTIIDEKLLVEVDYNDYVQKSFATIISPDAKWMAYIHNINNKQSVIMNGKEEKRYDIVKQGTIVFSQDSKHIAYAAKEASMWFVVVDGLEQPQYDDVGVPTFSPDGKQIAYAAKLNGKWIMFSTNTKTQTESVAYDEIGSTVFSQDNQRLVYKGKKGQQWFVNIDGKESPPYDDVIRVCFSDDGNRLAYVAKADGKQRAIVDGKEEPWYDDLRPFTLVFSVDNRHVAYEAKTNGKWFVVTDGIEGKRYDDITSVPCFSSDNKLAYGASLNGKGFAVIDGQEENRFYDKILDLQFIPGSNKIAYAVGVGENWQTVIDGKEQKSYKCLHILLLLFSSDGKRLSYWIFSESSTKLIIDEQEQPSYNGFSTVVFSPDSQHFAYKARIGNKWLVVVDGTEGKQYAEIKSSIVFDSPNTIHYIAQESNKFYLVEEKIE